MGKRGCIWYFVPDSGVEAYPALDFTPLLPHALVVHLPDLSQSYSVRNTYTVETCPDHFADKKR